MPASERVALLDEAGNPTTLLQAQASIYNRFTKQRKGVIVSVISLAGFIGREFPQIQASTIALGRRQRLPQVALFLAFQRWPAI